MGSPLRNFKYFDISSSILIGLILLHMTAVIAGASGGDSSSSNSNSNSKNNNNINDNNSNVTIISNETVTLDMHTDEDDGIKCQEGLLLSVWMPQENLTIGDKVSRGLVYFLAMLYLFIGVSIVSDRFMAAIEVITSKEKEVHIKKKNGETQIVVVRVWNETVANLTLMALGSSAPEILLSVIEMFAKSFEAGDLGPGTIVGSAAYNLFVIIAICIVVIPNGEVRKIKHLRVFFVTATWSVFAYIWLYIILAQFSPGRVEVWEGLLTFMFFPATVLTAYIADRRLLLYKYLDKNYRMNKRGVIVSAEGPDTALEMNNRDDGLKALEENGGIPNDEVTDFEEARREYISTLKDLRKKYPQSDLEQLEAMAQEQLINKGPKSRAFYRIQATRKMMGSGNIMRKIQERAQSDLTEVKAELLKRDETNVDEDDSVCRIYFEPGHYTVMESCGEFEVRVARRGDLSLYISVDFETEDGSAEAGSDYVGKKGTLNFPPGVDEQRFKIEVIDDDVFEQDEHFYVRLSNVTEPAILATPKVATVMILDDDHGGIFAFANKDHELVESVGSYDVKVQRYSGARGTVVIPYWTEDGTAKAGKDYEAQQGELTYEDNQSENLDNKDILGMVPGDDTKQVCWLNILPPVEQSCSTLIFIIRFACPLPFLMMVKCHLSIKKNLSTHTPSIWNVITVGILEEGSYEKDVLFYVNLGEPQMVGDDLVEKVTAAEAKAPEDLTEEDKMALLGRPKMGEVTRAQLRVKESKEFKNTVDKLVQRANASLLIGTSSWKEQFTEALTVNPGDDDGDGDDDHEPASPSCGDYILHFLTLFWKLLFAFIPPTDIYGGYLCFVVSIVCIGVVTAVIGDVASHFGCTLGIRDAVTAICFVALGTSIPDTFASKVAAIQDKYADASVGNVTGSNAVNVFLGIGVAWTIAAVYHAAHGREFYVSPGTLAFSVTLFCSEAAIAVSVLLLRRSKIVGGELGGPVTIKYISGAVLFGLWVIYVVVSSLEAYGVIKGF